MTGIRKKECIGIWRMDECSLSESIGVHSPFEVKSNHTVYWNLMIERKKTRSPDRSETHLKRSKMKLF